MGLLEGDQAGGELEQGEVVLVLLRPADEDRAVAVEPRVGALDHPAASPPARRLGLESDLLAAGADVGREAVLGGERVDRRRVVGAVEAEALGPLRRRLWALDRDRLDRRREQFQVVALRALVRDPDRDSRSLGEERALRPFFALSVGFGPVFGPPSGALVIAPSAASQAQSMPTFSS